MDRTDRTDVDDVAAEFEGDSLEDMRLDDRLRRIVSLAASMYVVKPIRATEAVSQETVPAVVPRGAASSDSLSVAR